MQYFWIWVTVLVLAVIIEIFTEKFFSILFAPGAVIGIILDLCRVGILWQVICFVAVSAIGIVLVKTVLSKYIPFGGKAQTNIEAIVGSKCIVVEKIDNNAGCGMAKVNGRMWSARSVSDDEVYEAGESLHVVAIEGVKLICRK